jgi:hypothetical protein
MPWLDRVLDPQVQAAALAGLFVAAGWLVNGWQNRRIAAALRDERVRDVLRALYSEIRAYVAVLRRDAVGTSGAEICRRIRHEPGFAPIVPSERNDTMFAAVVSEINVLPDGAIHSVVLYYSQLVAIVAMIEDLRALDIAAVGSDRAADMFADFLQMKIEAVELGADALRDIAEYLGYPAAPETEDLAAWLAAERAAISNRAADPSAR